MNISDQFKNNIKEWINHDNKEKRLKEEINDVKETKERLEEDILNYMERNNIEDREIIIENNSKLKYSKMKVTETITKKLIIEKLTEYYKNENKAKEITDYIYSDRKSELKKYLKKSDIK